MHKGVKCEQYKRAARRIARLFKKRDSQDSKNTMQFVPFSKVERLKPPHGDKSRRLCIVN